MPSFYILVWLFDILPLHMNIYQNYYLEGDLKMAMALEIIEIPTYVSDDEMDTIETADNGNKKMTKKSDNKIGWKK